MQRFSIIVMAAMFALAAALLLAPLVHAGGGGPKQAVKITIEGPYLAYTNASETTKLVVHINSQGQQLNSVWFSLDFDHELLNAQVLDNTSLQGGAEPSPSPRLPSCQRDTSSLVAGSIRYVGGMGVYNCTLTVQFYGKQEGFTFLLFSHTLTGAIDDNLLPFPIQTQGGQIKVGPARTPKFELRGPAPADWGLDPSYQVLVVSNPRPEEMWLVIQPAVSGCGNTSVGSYVHPFSSYTTALKPCAYVAGWSWSSAIPNMTDYFVVRAN